MKKECRTKIVLEKSKDPLGFKTNETSEPTAAMSLICRELVAAGKLFRARLTQTNSRYFSCKAAADLFLKNSPEKLRSTAFILENARKLAKTPTGYSPSKDGEGRTLEYRVAQKLIDDEGYFRGGRFKDMRVFANKCDAEKYGAKLQAPKKSVQVSQPKIWNIPAPVKTGINLVKAPKKPVEIINNVKVKYIPCPEYRPLVMSRDCRMAPESRAAHCRTPVLENP